MNFFFFNGRRNICSLTYKYISMIIAWKIAQLERVGVVLEEEKWFEEK